MTSGAVTAEGMEDSPSGRPAIGVAAFPLISENPYQQVLYGELDAHGFALVEDADFKLGWLLRARDHVDVLHFHWPQNYYRWWRRPAALRAPLSWVKMGLFAFRLAVARAMAYTVVWTVHEVYPHERAGRWLDRAGSSILARAANVLLAHDGGTADRAAAELGIRRSRVEIIPHGSYIGIYPAGRSRAEVRAALGIPEDAFVFLCFGHLRAYKAVDVLLTSFRSPHVPADSALIVAGVALDDLTEQAVRSAAVADPRIKAILEFVPDERVAELFVASDAAVLPRGDGGTSGSLVLALSMGLSAITADRPDYVELVGEAGWFFAAGDDRSLAQALAEAAADPAEVKRRGVEARRVAEELAWPNIAARTAATIAAALRRRRARTLA